MSTKSNNLRVAQRPLRVLVVDDSAYMRFTISKHLNDAPGLEVVGIATDGQAALELIPELLPDVITLDVEMPRMDGLTTLNKIMTTHPIPVIMLSSLTTEGASETIQALTSGAVDFIAKPASKANVAAIMNELIEKVRRASKARVSFSPRHFRREPRTDRSAKKSIRSMRRHDKVIVIGASTGGPKALSAVLSDIPQALDAALLIVQHMPVGFTRSLAERFDTLSTFNIKEAEPGEALETGKGLVAPGGFHMSVDNYGKIHLNQNPPVHGVRPAVDVTMSSVAQHFPGKSLGVILTGMGHDGTTGSILIHDAGGYIIAEAEESCVVWGMPRSVIEAGVADKVTPLHKIAEEIQRSVREGWQETAKASF